MNRLQVIIINHGIKLIVALKLGVLSYILYDYGFFIGDAPLTAQEQASPTSQEAPKAEPNQEDDEAVLTKRRSYLEDLLNLPKIDTSNLKKDEISRFLMHLDKKLQQVKDRTTILAKREAHLQSLENSIDDKLKKLDEEVTFFKQTIQKEKEIGQKRLDQLVEFYQKMTPKKAAPVFAQMDRDLVVALFKRIPKKQTMNILTLMPPQKSVELSEYFGRIRSGKEYELLQEINSSLRSEFQDCKGMPKALSEKKLP